MEERSIPFLLIAYYSMGGARKPPITFAELYLLGDLPGVPVVKNLPSNAENACSISRRGTKVPRAVGQLSPCATPKKPTCSRAHAPQGRPSTARKKRTAFSGSEVLWELCGGLCLLWGTSHHHMKAGKQEL